MSAWNPRATVNDRGLCFLVASMTAVPSKHMVLRLDMNKPKDGGVEATVVAVDLAADEADREAQRLHKESLT